MSKIGWDDSGPNSDTHKPDLYNLRRTYLIIGVLDNKFNGQNLNFFLVTIGDDWEFIIMMILEVKI